MKEIVFSADSYDALLAEAKRLGFVDAQGQIIVNGPVTDEEAYYLNYVKQMMAPTGNTIKDPFGNDMEEMQVVPGVWGRLRINGDEAALPSFSNTITQYAYSSDLGGWTSDGTTVAPEYVGTIGQLI
jgi:hypothetical protein